MKAKKGKPLAKRRSGKSQKRYSKPMLRKHGLLDAEAAAFSELY